MDPKSEWALGEFRDAPIELRFLDHKSAGSRGVLAKGGVGVGGAGGDIHSTPQQGQGRSVGVSSTAGGGRRVVSTHSAYQGERLAGLLVVKIEAGVGE